MKLNILIALAVLAILIALAFLALDVGLIHRTVATARRCPDGYNIGGLSGGCYRTISSAFGG